jgi:hypothetical protein
MKPAARFLLLLLAQAAVPSHAGILQRWTFDDAKPFHDLVIQGDAPKVVPDPKNPANKVMRSFLKPHAKRPERSEVMPGVIQVGEERWVGVRIMRPDKVHNPFNCFFQLGPIDGAKGHGGGGLYQLNNYSNGQWVFRGFMERVGAKGFSDNIGPVTYGEWDTWVFHIKLRADASGLVSVWRNGKPVAEHTGQNAFPGDRMRIKWGVYVGKGSEVAVEIDALYDDVVIADANSSLEAIQQAIKGAGK